MFYLKYFYFLCLIVFLSSCSFTGSYFPQKKTQSTSLTSVNQEKSVQQLNNNSQINDLVKEGTGSVQLKVINQEKIQAGKQKIYDLYSQGKIELAFSEGQKIYHTDMDDIDFQIFYAKILLEYADFTFQHREMANKALSILNPLFEKEFTQKNKPQKVEILTYLGYAYHNLGDYDAAIKIFNEAILLDDQSSTLMGYMGKSLLQTSNYAEGKVYIYKSYILDQNNASNAIIMAKINFSGRKEKDTLEIYKNIIKQGKNKTAISEAYYELGNLALFKKEYDHAIILFTKSLKYNSHSGLPYIGLSKAYFIQDVSAKLAKGENTSGMIFDKYVNLLKKAELKNPNRTLVFKAYVEMYFSVGSIDLANIYAEKFIQLIDSDIFLGIEEKKLQKDDMEFFKNQFLKIK